MSNLDDRIRDVLRRAAPRVEPPDLGEDFAGRAKRHEIRRRLGSGMLAFAVIGGTVLGYNGLQLAFGPGDVSPTGAGVIAFTRGLEDCPGHPNIEDSGLDVFAVAPDGSREWAVASGLMFDRNDNRNEEEVSFSPDGNRYAWVDQFSRSLYVSDVLTGVAQQLVEGFPYYDEPRRGAWIIDRPEWSPSGDLIAFSGGPYQVDETQILPRPAPGEEGVYTVALDGSEPRLIARGGTHPIWSPDGKTIAFQRIDRTQQGGITGRRLFFVNADGTNERLIRAQPADANFSVNDAEWSPDGTRFVVEAFVQGSHDLFVVNIDGETGYRLTDDAADEISPTWSPDGQQIAFATNRWGEKGDARAEIAMIGARGGPVTRLTDNCWNDMRPDWVTDSSTIESLPAWTPPPLPALTKGLASPDQILVSSEVEGVSDIYGLDPAGGAPVNLTADIDYESDPAWSHDRERIAYTFYPDDGTGGGIYVMDRRTGEAQRVVPHAARPSWSPDDSMLAYESGDGGIWVVGSDGSNPHPVTDPGPEAFDMQPDWSPDGRSIVFTRGGGGRGLMQVAVGTGLESVVLDRESAQEPDWSPDGSQIVFQLENDIAVIDRDGSNMTLLTPGSTTTFDRGPAWSPDGTQIAYVSSEPPSPSDEHDGLRLYVMDADGSNAHVVSGSPGDVQQAVGW